MVLGRVGFKGFEFYGGIDEAPKTVRARGALPGFDEGEASRDGCDGDGKPTNEDEGRYKARPSEIRVGADLGETATAELIVSIVN